MPQKEDKPKPFLVIGGSIIDDIKKKIETTKIDIKKTFCEIIPKICEIKNDDKK